ncbi:MAG TPA: hypothetical protein VEG30_17950 [Terriglobales bacterium]|nr:hypothetical protein [Terriglobales bacterium]
MLRLLGFVLVVVICVGMAPWGLLVGAILLFGWLLVKPAPNTPRLRSLDEQLRASRLLSAIPLVNAVYCVNCDLITNSPHDACGVCASRSVIAVSRMWQLTLTEAPTKAAKFKVSFTADVRGIPASGLNDCTKLISRLTELGGEVKSFHITVDSVSSSDAVTADQKFEVLKPVGRAPIGAWQDIRQAS